MHRFIFIALIFSLISISPASQATEPKEFKGAGGTFPYPVYSKWAEAYEKATGIKLNYLSVGSKAGIQQIIAGTVDFGASDMPLKPDELQKQDLFQFPTFIGGVAIAYNIKGIENNALKLTGSLLSDIYLGKITKWNDDQIKQINPDLALPDEEIKVIYRSEGSGTTFIFTTYLSEVSPEWKEKVGADTTIKWPVGDGAKGNGGVTALINRIPGSIGYVEFASAYENKLNLAQLQNHDGAFVEPTLETFKAAAVNADWEKAQNFYLILTNQPGQSSWPIVGATYILLHKKSDNPEATLGVVLFWNWALDHGDKTATNLSNIALPPNLKELVKKGLQQELKDANGNPIWKQ